MSDSRKRLAAHRFRSVLLGSVLGGFLLLGTGASAQAQSWPGDAGPGSDILGLTMRQYQRLGLPPVEVREHAERVVPGLPATNPTPAGSVDVDSPAISQAAPLPASSGRTYGASGAARRRVTPAAPGRSAGHEWKLRRELAIRDQELRSLRRQVRDGHG